MKKLKILLCLLCVFGIAGCSSNSDTDKKDIQTNDTAETTELLEKTGNKYFSKQYKDKYLDLSNDGYFMSGDSGEAFILPIPQFFVNGEFLNGHSMLRFQTDEGKYVSLSATLKYDSAIKDTGTHKENPINDFFNKFDKFVTSKSLSGEDPMSILNQESLKVKTTKLNSKTVEADVVTAESTKNYTQDTVRKNIVSYWVMIGDYNDETICLELDITAALLSHDELKDIAEYFINNLDRKTVDKKEIKLPTEINVRTEDIALNNKKDFLKEYSSFKESAMGFDIPTNAEVFSDSKDGVTFKINDKNNNSIGTGIFDRFSEFMDLGLFNMAETFFKYGTYTVAKNSIYDSNAYPFEKIVLSNQNLKAVTINGQNAVVNYGDMSEDSKKVGAFSIISINYEDDRYTLISVSEKVSAKKLFEFQLGLLERRFVNVD